MSSYRTGLTVADAVDALREQGKDPYEQVFYVSYADIIHTSPDCPHLAESRDIHTAASTGELPTTYCLGGRDPEKLLECGWCADHDSPTDHAESADLDFGGDTATEGSA